MGLWTLFYWAWWISWAPFVGMFIARTSHVRTVRELVVALRQSVQAMIALTLAISSAGDHITREMIFILAFLLGAARSFEMPATQALLPSIVPVELFPRAVAAAQAAQQSATIVAPAFGGLLYAFGSVWVYGPSVAVAFQDPSLLPWLSLEKNVAFGLDFARQPQLSHHERRRRVDHAIAAVGLEHARQHFPAQLSGGMAQRTALARCLARQAQAAVAG